MNIQNSPWLPLTLIGIGFFAVGADFNARTESNSESVTKNASWPQAEKMPNRHRNESASFQVDGDITREDYLATSADAPTQNASKSLPGEFRGDWGETPVYARNDRVNFENAAYLSLENDNQNQPPSTSSQFWQLLKQFKAVEKQACVAALPGTDLTQCDFSQELSLKGKQLPGATLTKARLAGELGDANLSGANLSGAAVIGSLLIGPNTRIDHANLSKLQSDGNNPLIAESADFNHSDFSAANLSGAKLKDANFSDTKLTSANLTGAELTGSRLSGSDLRQADLSFAEMSSAEFRGANLSAANLSEANLINSDFSHARLQHASLAGSDLAGADLSAADLRHANLVDVKNADSAVIDSETDFTAATCPDGKKVDGNRISSCIGHGF